ncbi:MAG: 4Fe-4S binding protein [Elusimicrobia bacterium]|nr:4Fe-4S binding protein [Elusimicrobiota bacterium]
MSEPRPSRRQMLVRSAAAAAGGGFLLSLLRRGESVPASSVPPDLARRIRCQRCAEACDLCLACGKARPTGALRPLEKMADARMGTAVVDKRLCVSHKCTGVCGACFTIFPLKGKAITQGKHNAPAVDEEHCTGCGLCEEACIVTDRDDGRSIRVRSERAWS